MLNTQSIGTEFPHGFAGAYSRQPDMIVKTVPGADTVVAGIGVVASDAAALPTEVAAAADFGGVVVAEVKTALNFIGNKGLEYVEGDAVPVMIRGCVNVECRRGAPEPNGNVYWRIKANDTYPDCIVGGLEAVADGSNTVLLPNVKWNTYEDVNSIAEIRILYPVNA